MDYPDVLIEYSTINDSGVLNIQVMAAITGTSITH